MSATQGPPPYEVLRPSGTPRLLYDSPHSGRHYPDDWPVHASRQDLRRGEDAWVDELITPAVGAGAVVLLATWPRCYIDLNREPDDIDAALLAEPWPGPLRPTEKSARGLGLIRRFVAPGIEVNARPLTVAEVRARIEGIHQPYLAALDALVEEQRAVRDRVLHLDWHSMKSIGNAMTPDGPGARRADFVVSDRDGATAGGELVTLVCDTLQELGYSVSRNAPYKGGAIVRRVGNPGRGIHSIQVEINRALYLDEVRVERTAGFDPLRADLRLLAGRLAAAIGPA